MKIYAISDLHTDYDENRKYISDEMKRKNYEEDVLIVGGDISHKIGEVLVSLKRSFKEVFFIPGNHDLWIFEKERRAITTSLDILDELRTMCDRIGVEHKPKTVAAGVAIVPLYSWYDRDFLEGTLDANIKSIDGWGDSGYCVFPEKRFPNRSAICKYFDDMNEELLDSWGENLEDCKMIISFSHFLPRRELMPPTPVLYVPEILSVMGTRVLEDRIRKIGSHVHVFGHSHIGFDHKLEGVRYISNPLRYPRERKRWNVKPNFKCVHEVPSSNKKSE